MDQGCVLLKLSRVYAVQNNPHPDPLPCRKGICLPLGGSPDAASAMAVRRRSAELHTISISGNQRNSRRFFAGLSSSSSPHDAGVGRGPRRGAAPPLPSPLLHQMEERECLVAAPPRYAVSQICNLRSARSSGPSRQVERSADYNSAIRQIENLRYGKMTYEQIILWMHCSLFRRCRLGLW
jgi:hypothetical protein